MNNVLNFRDAGGYMTAEGFRVKEKILFRSGNIDNIYGIDLDRFYSLKIKSIIDLRQTDEQRKFSKALSGVKKLNISINTTRKTREVLHPFIRKRQDAKIEITSAIAGIYKDIVENQKDEVAKIFNHLSKIDSYPVLIHCHIGKDRTGFVIAIILMALAVDISLIKYDYLLSNEYLFKRTKKISRLIKIFSLGSFPVSNLEFSTKALEDYICAVYNLIIEKYGGVNKYLNSCGVEDEDILKFREILLDKYPIINKTNKL